MLGGGEAGTFKAEISSSAHVWPSLTKSKTSGPAGSARRSSTTSSRQRRSGVERRWIAVRRRIRCHKLSTLWRSLSRGGPIIGRLRGCARAMAIPDNVARVGRCEGWSYDLGDADKVSRRSVRGSDDTLRGGERGSACLFARDCDIKTISGYHSGAAMRALSILRWLGAAVLVSLFAACPTRWRRKGRLCRKARRTILQ